VGGRLRPTIRFNGLFDGASTMIQDPVEK